jgi:hypothetical protein
MLCLAAEQAIQVIQCIVVIMSMLFFPCKLQFFHTGTKDLHLPLDTLPAGSSDGVPLLDTVLKVEHTLDHVRFKLVRQFLVLLECDVG